MEAVLTDRDLAPLIVRHLSWRAVYRMMSACRTMALAATTSPLWERLRRRMLERFGSRELAGWRAGGMVRSMPVSGEAHDWCSRHLVGIYVVEMRLQGALGAPPGPRWCGLASGDERALPWLESRAGCLQGKPGSFLTTSDGDDGRFASRHMCLPRHLWTPSREHLGQSFHRIACGCGRRRFSVISIALLGPEFARRVWVNVEFAVPGCWKGGTD